MENFLWGFWNGATAMPLLILHVFDIWTQYPVFNVARDNGWYQFGFLLGVGATAGSATHGGASARRRG